MKIEHRYTKAILWEGEAKTLREAVLAAIKADANLRYADLSYAGLSGADLSYAGLSDANLRYADLSYAGLSGADLSYADLSGADLSGANLSYADLSGANLSGADLSGADLSGANLSYADLSGANLSGADILKTLWPAPTSVLLANWGDVKDELCTELMRYDAFNHPDPARFQAWAAGSKRCPYEGTFIQRSANFQEKRALYSPGPAKSAYELMMMLLKEKCVEKETTEETAG